MAFRNLNIYSNLIHAISLLICTLEVILRLSEKSFFSGWRKVVLQTRIFLKEWRPCTFCQSLWYTNCPVNFSFFLVDQTFSYRPNYFLVYQIFFWSTKFLFGIQKIFFGKPNFILVDQINEKLTGQLVYQRD